MLTLEGMETSHQFHLNATKLPVSKHTSLPLTCLSYQGRIQDFSNGANFDLIYCTQFYNLHTINDIHLFHSLLI